MLICDIDETITEGGYQLLFSRKDLVPFPGSSQVLDQLSERYEIVFLTARDETFLNETRDWLDLHHFPPAPVVGRDWSLSNLTQTGDFKSAVLKEWKSRFPRIEWGIGNSEGDCQAYREAGIPHLSLGKPTCIRGNGVECRAVRDWTEVAAVLRRLDKGREKPGK